MHLYWANYKIQDFIWHNDVLVAKYLKCIWGHCKTNIEGADGIWRLLEDVTFFGLRLAYHLDIKIVLSYDPAILKPMSNSSDWFIPWLKWRFILHFSDHHHREVNNSHLFNDTTRIRMNSRPSIKDAFNTGITTAGTSLGRRGISQSFKVISRSSFKALELWILRPFLGWRYCFYRHFMNTRTYRSRQYYESKVLHNTEVN